MPSPRLRIYNNKEVRDELRAYAERGGDMRPFGQAWADQVIDINRRQFASPKGWKKLRPSTRARKARQGLDPRILVATGRLRASLTSRGDRDHVRIVTAKGAFVGTTVWYARFHKKTRPPVKLQPTDRRETVAMAQDYISSRTGGVRWQR